MLWVLFFLLLFFLYKFIYFWLPLVIVAARRLPLAAASWGHSSLHMLLIVVASLVAEYQP